VFSAEVFRGGRVDAGKWPENLADLAEIETGLEILDKVENIALRVALRVPPAAAAVADDQHFALAAAIFEAVLGAFGSIELPWWRKLFEQDGAIDLGAQPLDFGIVSSHSCAPR
jgi:hypothetical protein